MVTAKGISVIDGKEKTFAAESIFADKDFLTGEGFTKESILFKHNEEWLTFEQSIASLRKEGVKIYPCDVQIL
jgi:sialic acid synthase SpsE